MNPGFVVRREEGADFPAVRSLLRAAFGDDEVADLVDLLRAAPGYRPDLALVAAEPAGGVIGHVMLTEVAVDGTQRVDPVGAVAAGSGRAGRVFSLAPLAVRPDWHRQGVGRALVTECLALADRIGASAVVVEGDPAIYSRYGFVDARERGLLAPSPTIPDGAFQAFSLGAAGVPGALGGRVRYPAPFWAGGGSGLPEPAEPAGTITIPWLFQFARYAGWIEAVAAGCDLTAAVPTCPSWTLADLLAHLGGVHRRVDQWIRDGHRPMAIPAVTGGPHAWYAAGWRALFTTMAQAPAGAAAATWSAFDNTMGFWRRRMLHEIVIHAVDALETCPEGACAWSVPDNVALDGIDEVLRTFLGIRVGMAAAGTGRLVEIRAGDRIWTVGMSQGHALEVHSLPEPPVPDATVSGDPATIYRWLWGRADGGLVAVNGDQTTIADLRQNLTAAMR